MKSPVNNAIAKGHYKVAVVDASTGNTVWEMPEWRSNLVLNSGMNKKASLPWEDLFTHAVAGTGATPNYKSSGTQLVTQSEFELITDGTGNLDFLTDVEVGDVIVLSSTVGRLVVNVVNGTFAQTDTAATSSAVIFNVAYTSRIGLDWELKRTNDWYTGAVFCGSVIEGPLVRMRRTYNFSVESEQVTYNEIGFTWSADAAEPLLSRIVLDAPVTVDAGFYLRAFYELQVTHDPWTPSALLSPIDPLTESGYQGIQAFAGTCTSFVETNGSSAGNPLIEGLTKVSDIYGYITDFAGSMQASGTYAKPDEDAAVTVATALTTKDEYVDNSFQFARQCTFVPGSFTKTFAQSGLTGGDDVVGTQLFYTYRFNDGAHYEMAGTDQARLSWQFSWTRHFLDIP